MKILLIGRTGQVGSEILKESKSLGYNIKAFSRKELNIADFNRVVLEIETFKPEVVVNASAYHLIPECEKNPEEAFTINTISLVNLAKICGKGGIRLVHFSTDRVFDGKTARPYKETDRPNPMQVYGLSKYAGEIACLNYNPDSIIIRTCGIFGGVSGSRVKNGNFVLYILSESKKRKTLEISSDQIASFAYAEDLAKATLDLLGKKAKSGIYNITNTGYDSWAEFAKEIVRIRKINFEIIPVNRHGQYGNIPTPAFTAFDLSKLRRLGIKMPTWQNGLKRYLDFLSAN